MSEKTISKKISSRGPRNSISKLGKTKFGMITQKQLANLAGVSMSTIYNAFHCKELVHEDTLNRIYDLMDEYDYRPNGIARAMVRGKTDVVGVVIPRIDIPYYSMLVADIENNIGNNGYNCIICQHLDDLLKEKREINLMRERCVDGMIIRASGSREDSVFYKKLDEIGMPFVIIDREIPGMEHRYVGIDNIAASEQITEYLISKGHRRIAAVLWPESTHDMGPRYDGYRKALIKHGIKVDSSIVEICSSEYFAGYEETCKILDCPASQRPTAILGGNEAVIVGILKALENAKIKVPNDIAVATIGCDLPEIYAPLPHLKLTYAAIPIGALAREASLMLRSQIESKNWQHGPIFCPTEVRIGDSA